MKKLVSKETIADVSSMIKSADAVFDACEITGNFAVRLGNVVIRKACGTSVVELDSTVNKEMFAQWKRDVGRFLSRDLSHGVYSNLYELKAEGKKALLRKIPSAELPDMRAEGFDHVYIGDYHYTIIKVVPINGKYTDADENYSSEDYLQYSYISEFSNDDTITEEEKESQGIALFNYDDFTPAASSETENEEITED